MSGDVEYFLNRASEAEICKHLRLSDADFIPHLSSRVDIGEYAKKIAGNALKVEAWSGEELVGLVAAYCNDQETHIAYITSVSVLMKWAGKGLATQLVGKCIEYAKSSGMHAVNLEVASNSVAAIKLYEKIGFVVSESRGQWMAMTFLLNAEGKNE